MRTPLKTDARSLVTHWLLVGTIMLLAVVLGVTLATDGLSMLAMVIMLGSAAVLVSLIFFGIGLYGQFLIFLSLLQIFVFAIKVGYGAVNTTLLALLPSIFVGLMIVQVVLLMSRGKIHLRWTLLDLSVAAFFLLDLLQVLNPYLDIFSDQRFLVVGLRGFQQRTFLGLSYFVARGLIRSERQFDTIARILAYSSALSGFYALIQQLFGFVLLESQHRQVLLLSDPEAAALYTNRAVGFLGSQFTFGMVSAMGMLSSLYLLMSGTLSWRERFLAMLSALINGAAVLLSGSRSTYLSLILAVTVVVLWIPWRRLFESVWRVRWVILITVVVLTVVIVLFHASPLVQYSIQRVVTLGELGKLLLSQDEITETSFTIRRELAIETWLLIVDNPFGYGTGIFNGGSNPDGVVKVKGYSTWVDNEFSSLALELGVQGVLLLLAIVALAVWRCRRAACIPGLRGRAITLVALVVICPAAGFGGQWLAAYPANVLFWVFTGVIAGLPLFATTEVSHTIAADLAEN